MLELGIFIKFLLSAITLKFLYNLYYFLLNNYYLSKYNDYIENLDKPGNGWDIVKRKHSIVNVFKRAGLGDSKIPYIQPAGWGYVATGSTSLFDNVNIITHDIPPIVMNYFIQARSIFVTRMFEGFNPIYWIELVIYLPKNIFIYLGVKPDNVIIKIFQLIYWLLGLASILIGIFFNKEFMHWASKLMFF